MQKEGVVEYFKVLSRHRLEIMTNATKNSSHECQFSGRGSNRAYPECKSEVLPTEQSCSVEGGRTRKEGRRERQGDRRRKDMNESMTAFQNLPNYAVKQNETRH
jgi:hypothetical protein